MAENTDHDQNLYPTGKIVDLHYFTGDSTSVINVVVSAWGERALHVVDLSGRLQSFPYSSIQRLVVS